MKSSAWVILLGASLAVGAWAGGLVGYYLGARQATEAWDTAVMQHCADEVQQAIDLTAAECGRQVETLVGDLTTTCTAISNDYGWRVEWMQDVMEHSAAWLYSDQDTQRAYDLLWCASGTGTPLQGCLDMLVEGRQP